MTYKINQKRLEAHRKKFSNHNISLIINDEAKQKPAREFCNTHNINLLTMTTLFNQLNKALPDYKIQLEISTLAKLEQNTTYCFAAASDLLRVLSPALGIYKDFDILIKSISNNNPINNKHGLLLNIYQKGNLIIRNNNLIYTDERYCNFFQKIRLEITRRYSAKDEILEYLDKKLKLKIAKHCAQIVIDFLTKN